MDFDALVLLAARAMEGAGVAVMIGGGLFAVVAACVRRGLDGPGRYRALRQHLGRSILLGLEFLVAADIVRTVSKIPTLEEVVVLAMIVLIRTFLSFTLQLELEGRWPWQRTGLPEAEAPGRLGAPPETERTPAPLQ